MWECWMLSLNQGYLVAHPKQEVGYNSMGPGPSYTINRVNMGESTYNWCYKLNGMIHQIFVFLE